MSLEVTVMVECRIVDAPRTQAHLLRTGQAVLFGGKVMHVAEAYFCDGDFSSYIQLKLNHYDEQGMVTVTELKVKKTFMFDCIRIIPMKQLKDTAS